MKPETNTPSCWEVVTFIPDPANENKQLQCHMLIVANTIDQIWDYLAADRADTKITVETIHRVGHVVAILSSPVPSTQV